MAASKSVIIAIVAVVVIAIVAVAAFTVLGNGGNDDVKDGARVGDVVA